MLKKRCAQIQNFPLDRKTFPAFPFIWLLLLFLQLPNYARQQSKIDTTFTTEDNFTIAATLGIPDSVDKPRPAVILIHQGGSNRGEWKGFFDQLLEQNYVVLAYDVRGHGQSTPVKDIYALFNDPNQAPLDLKAAIFFLKSLEQIDPARIALVGASIGGNLAGVGISKMGIKTAVAISGKISAMKNLHGAGKLNLKSIFFIAADGDQDGKRAEWAKDMYEITHEPRLLSIVKNSQSHGVSIFEDDPTVIDQILKWLEATL